MAPFPADAWSGHVARYDGIGGGPRHPARAGSRGNHRGHPIEVDHLKAYTVGDRVRVWARYEGANGRFLGFEVTAHCREKAIGRGRVFRAIVDPTRHGS